MKTSLISTSCLSVRDQNVKLCTLPNFHTKSKSREPHPCFENNYQQFLRGKRVSLVVRANKETPSFLDQWKKARSEDQNLRNISEDSGVHNQITDSRESRFENLLKVSEDERNAAESSTLIDRASAALAAVQALLNEDVMGSSRESQAFRGRPTRDNIPSWSSGSKLSLKSEPIQGPSVSVSRLKNDLQRKRYTSSPSDTEGDNPSNSTKRSSPGPDFWTWVPPDELSPNATLMPSRAAPKPLNQSLDFEEPVSKPSELSIPLQSSFVIPSLPPLQSLLENDLKTTEVHLTSAEDQREKTEEALKVPAMPTETLPRVEAQTEGITEDGTRIWRESGREERENGEICDWTIVRGKSADGTVEWEEKWWETWDEFGYKELGAEKSGRNANGGTWRETWREAMWQDAQNGLVHIEKSADKWGRNEGSEVNGEFSEWREQWWEHYDALGRAEKWAHKWCQLDKDKPLDAGHAHIWHEKWGEEYDGKGATQKYSDKWAERHEGSGYWSKWGDKWGEDFGADANGNKGGETWWEGPHGERWNRTWGEDHNNSGWVHKFGQSSSGEHWDTHEEMDTWYEKVPHFGFRQCLDTSRRLREVGTGKHQGNKKKKTKL